MTCSGCVSHLLQYFDVTILESITVRGELPAPQIDLYEINVEVVRIEFNVE